MPRESHRCGLCGFCPRPASPSGNLVASSRADKAHQRRGTLHRVLLARMMWVWSKKKKEREKEKKKKIRKKIRKTKVETQITRCSREKERWARAKCKGLGKEQVPSQLYIALLLSFSFMQRKETGFCCARSFSTPSSALKENRKMEGKRRLLDLRVAVQIVWVFYPESGEQGRKGGKRRKKRREKEKGKKEREKKGREKDIERLACGGSDSAPGPLSGAARSPQRARTLHTI